MMLLIYMMTFFGFGVKAAIFPFHGWLPAVSVAPTPVTALLHAVAVVKSGAFAVLRLTYYSFGASYLFWHMGAEGGHGRGACDHCVCVQPGAEGNPF